MPQIATILQDEVFNEGAHIRLYAEGVFYKAYERSAWVACRVLHPFMVKKRAVRKVGQEVVSNHKGELRELVPYVEAFLKDELGEGYGMASV